MSQAAIECGLVPPSEVDVSRINSASQERARNRQFEQVLGLTPFDAETHSMIARQRFALRVGGPVLVALVIACSSPQPTVEPLVATPINTSAATPTSIPEDACGGSSDALNHPGISNLKIKSPVSGATVQAPFKVIAETTIAEDYQTGFEQPSGQQLIGAFAMTREGERIGIGTLRVPRTGKMELAETELRIYADPPTQTQACLNITVATKSSPESPTTLVTLGRQPVTIMPQTLNAICTDAVWLRTAEPLSEGLILLESPKRGEVITPEVTDRSWVYHINVVGKTTLQPPISLGGSNQRISDMLAEGSPSLNGLATFSGDLDPQGFRSFTMKFGPAIGSGGRPPAGQPNTKIPYCVWVFGVDQSKPGLKPTAGAVGIPIWMLQ